MTKHKIIHLSIDDLEKLQKILSNTNSRKKRKRKIKKVLKGYDEETKLNIKKHLKKNNYNLDGIKTISDMKGYAEIIKNPYDNRFIFPQFGNNNLDTSINNLTNEIKGHNANTLLLHNNNKRDINNIREERNQDNEKANELIRDGKERLYNIEEDILKLKNRMKYQLIDNSVGNFGTNNAMENLHSERDIIDDAPENEYREIFNSNNDVNNYTFDENDEMLDNVIDTPLKSPKSIFKRNDEEYKQFENKDNLTSVKKGFSNPLLSLGKLFKKNKIDTLPTPPPNSERLFETNDKRYDKIYPENDNIFKSKNPIYNSNKNNSSIIEDIINFDEEEKKTIHQL
jgi:hypothetical protein